MGNPSPYLLEVRELKKHYTSKSGLLSRKKPVVKAVDGISLNIRKGEILGLVGESGCGKSTLGRSILRLIEPTSGNIVFEGQDILAYGKEEKRMMRKELQIIFQDSGAALNPRMTVGEIIGAPLDIYGLAQGEAKERRINELLELVGLNKDYVNRFPHEFSGGQKQRIGIARALAVEPKLIVCDEPVSALDVSVRAQVLNLMKELKEKLGLTYLFISHDLSVVHHLCDRVAVMYLGKIVEITDRNELYGNPLHPYTKALLSAIPNPNPEISRERIVLEGDVPSPSNPPPGCSFHTRCPYRMDKCSVEVPILLQTQGNHSVSCHLYNDEH
ncbi:ABC transporter ATP-binding protein [Paenibacillus riograndensis]|uniref:Oligopeptide transport ATP-binding protein AppF n=1 Tax=Paenibacillus riograndensis SBR5 TaxID=1073571 RepID=A0A0E4CY27_9BACL|nr:ABC transporter ATP-binding protein [Paenibacillus riograndensis]CQR56976.1 Oligopeptide transport ATP-binding protein AppF [Paenibacillus riograndensis SBR5]